MYDRSVITQYVMMVWQCLSFGMSCFIVRYSCCQNSSFSHFCGVDVGCMLLVEKWNKYTVLYMTVFIFIVSCCVVIVFGYMLYECVFASFCGSAAAA